MICGVVLAAGAASRFGAPKALAPFAGRPLLSHPIAALRAAGVDRLVVVLGAEAEAIRATVPPDGAEVVICDDWRAGLSASLAAGLRAAEGCEAAVVVLGDQPLLDAEAIRRVIAARGPGRPAIRATYGERPGHPVLLERETWAAASAVGGDAGARELLRGPGAHLVACDGLGSDADVDVPADLARLESGGTGPDAG